MTIQIPVIESQTERTRKEKKGIKIVTGTDVHGQSCGITAYYTLKDEVTEPLTIYAHFKTPQDPRPSSLAVGLPDVLQQFCIDQRKVMIFDIPIYEREAERAKQAFGTVLMNGVEVEYFDHHGHSKHINDLRKMGVKIYLFGTSYDVGMYLPRIYNKVDSFAEKWSFIGALADLDYSIAWRAPYDLEELVCEYLDQAMKMYREKIAEMLHLPKNPDFGNAGSLIYGIVEKGVEPEQVIEVARQIVKPLELPSYKTIGDVAYLLEKPKQYGLVWKMLWKLCYVTGCKIGIAPAFDPQKNCNKIIIAKDWRHPEMILYIEKYVHEKFVGKGVNIVGHEGAVGIELPQGVDIKPEEVEQIAKELNEMLEREIIRVPILDVITVPAMAEQLYKTIQQFTRYLSQIRTELSEIRRELQRKQ